MIDYHEAASVHEACELLRARPDAKALAGGTAVVLMLGQGLIAPSQLISIRRLEELRGIEGTSEGLRIGGATTLYEVGSHPLVTRQFPALAAACRQVGNRRVQHVATIGGNLCEADYASDPPAVLMSLEAECELRSSSGTRFLPVAQLVTGFYQTALSPGELLVSVRVPWREQTACQSYIRFTSRSSEDRPCVTVAVSADLREGGAIDGLRVVVGAVAPTPRQFTETTEAVRGQTLDEELAEHMGAAIERQLDPLSDLRGSAWYRKKVAGALAREAIGRIALQYNQEGG